MQDPSLVEFPAIRQPAPFPEQEQLKCPRCDSANTKFCYYNNYNLSQPRYFCKDCRRYWTKGGALRNIPVGGGTRKNASAKRSSTNSKRANPDPTPDSPRVTRRVSEPPPSPPSSSSAPAAAAVADTFSASTQQYRLLTTESEPGQNQNPTRVYGLEADQGSKFAGGGNGGSFSHLLTANSQYGGIFDGLSTSGSDLKTGQMVGSLFGEDLNSGLSMGSGREMGLDLELQERGGAGGSDGGDGGGGGGGEGYLQGGEWGNSSNGWPDLAIYTPGSNFH